MIMSQLNIKEKLLDSKQRKYPKNCISYTQEMKLFLRLLFSFQRNYQAFFIKIDPAGAGKDIEFVNRIPGYRKYQLIFMFYLRRFGLPTAFLATLLFPLPFTALFLLAGPLLSRLSGMGLSGEIQLVLIGLRCSVLSYICRYCLHFPDNRLSWMIYLGSVLCAVISSNNYTFIATYALALALSYFKSQDVSTRDSVQRQEDSFKQQKEQFKKFDYRTLKGGLFYAISIVALFLGLWMAQRIYVHSHGRYYLVQLFLIGLLGTNQELASFFPGLCGSMSHILPTANIYALGYLLPGLHLKTFFVLFSQQGWSFICLSYLAVHLPSLLMLCAALANREAFLSVGWTKMRASMQAASNGLLLVAVGTMLSEESCHRHIVFFTTLVIFTVTKLYKFNQIISALLGVFLVASRAAVLHLNNKKSLSDFLCRNK